MPLVFWLLCSTCIISEICTRRTINHFSALNPNYSVLRMGCLRFACCFECMTSDVPGLQLHLLATHWKLNQNSHFQMETYQNLFLFLFGIKFHLAASHRDISFAFNSFNFHSIHKYMASINFDDLPFGRELFFHFNIFNIWITFFILCHESSRWTFQHLKRVKQIISLFQNCNTKSMNSSNNDPFHILTYPSHEIQAIFFLEF